MDHDAPTTRPGQAPHRGGTVLALGVLSLVLSGCSPVGLILGAIAMAKAKADLLAMDRGAMDREGWSLTMAGRICGIIGVVIGALMLLYWLLMIGLLMMGAFAGAAAAAAGANP